MGQRKYNLSFKVSDEEKQIIEEAYHWSIYNTMAAFIRETMLMVSECMNEEGVKQIISVEKIED